ncbi:hypothetical protein RNB81_002619 [Salmonella enterica subsp. enterica serovar Cerro]|nr:hypothetical protein [Salmonella enterica subsp. enterica serovar Cerro]EHV1966490.1 hypothetical protein [Salmonella enterica subsp. enterica serovar Cerro]EIK5429071.1 hypothetical protein [Salmonella enterica subsp. enterica serovar Cerro]EJV5331323.1 hypothetical protein [Salmonella enterica]ELF1331080.1 hypothetical protein [Salmonella enterica subsp. enterica serovar Cerro]
MVDDKPMRIGWVFYFSYIFVAIIFHLFISFCYCLNIDMAEANTVVFFIKARDDFIIIFASPCQAVQNQTVGNIEFSFHYLSI